MAPPPPPHVLRGARRLALGTLAGLLVACGGGGAPPEVDPGPLLPDGRTRGSVDFTIDQEQLATSVLVRERTFAPTDCAVVEGTIASAGTRRLLVFDTLLVNLGELDCVIGDPAAPEPPVQAADFEYHDCHGHRHMHGYAAYELRRPDGSLAALGTKQGFCLLDNQPVHPAARPTRTYDCAYQGLASGWADLYARTVEGQWVDVTGLPAGAYVLRVTVNAEGTLPEAVDVHPNTAEVAVTLPDPSEPVASGDDHADVQPAATPLAFPIGLRAELEHTGDVDWFRFDVQAGREYDLRIVLEGLSDSRMRLVASSGATLASNDDAAPGDPSSRILWTAILSGTVWLEVQGQGGATGGYRVVLE